ncbi:MAG: hypothetical protein IPP47_01075 [Bryobacterales bacterium]|nr:hypothetical protein [Bryobacterales bacterium]
MRPAAVFLALLTLAACSRESPFTPIPPQAQPVTALDPPSVPCLFSMTETRADQFIVTGIPLGLGAGANRWTNEGPAVHCALPTPGPWLIAMDFILADVTFRATGPITITFTVDGHELKRLRLDKPGPYQFRAPLPPELATPGKDRVLQASIDKPYIAAGDGNKLGVLVSAMGFVQP